MISVHPFTLVTYITIDSLFIRDQGINRLLDPKSWVFLEDWSLTSQSAPAVGLVFCTCQTLQQNSVLFLGPR